MSTGGVGGGGSIMAHTLDKKTKKSLIKWKNVDPRILRARLYSKPAKLTIISFNYPKNEAEKIRRMKFL